jgi:hypothetical protein
LGGVEEVFVLAAVAGEEVGFLALVGVGELDEAGAVVAEEVEVGAVVKISGGAVDYQSDGVTRKDGKEIVSPDLLDTVNPVGEIGKVFGGVSGNYF